MKSIRLLITGFILIIVGALVCGASFVLMGFDFRSLDTAEYVTRTYDAATGFDKISVEGDTENISFALSDNGKCYVVCKEHENDKHDVRTDSDTLRIKNVSDRVFFIGFTTEEPEMTIYLPKDRYLALTVNSDTGNVYIPENFSFGDIDVRLDTGDLTCPGYADGNVSIKTDTGKVSLQGMAPETLTIATDTGKVSLQGMTPETLTIATDTGDIVLSEIDCAGKLDIRVHTALVEMNDVNCAGLSTIGSTGKLRMTNVISAGNWEIRRDTGDISFESCDAADSISIITTTGDVAGSLLSDKIFNVSTDTGKVNVPDSSAGGACEIRTDTGDISVSIH